MGHRERERFKERVMKAAHIAEAASRYDDGMFERDALALEVGVNRDDPQEQRRFDDAIAELEDAGRLIRASKDNAQFRLGPAG